MKVEFENDDNGTGNAYSNFVDDKEKPYISDPKVITSMLQSIEDVLLSIYTKFENNRIKNGR